MFQRSRHGPEPGHHADCRKPAACMLFIIQEEMSRVAAGGGVCLCRADGGSPRGKCAAEQVERLEGLCNLDTLNKWRWSNQNNGTCCSPRYLSYFQMLTGSFSALPGVHLSVQKRSCCPGRTVNLTLCFYIFLWLFGILRPTTTLK